MKYLSLCIAALLLAGCAFTHIEERRPDGSYSIIDTKVISVPEGFLGKIMDLAAGLLNKQPAVVTTTPPVVVPTPTPNPPLDPIAPEPDEPVTSVDNIAVLRGTGFLWKPAAENPPHGLAVLTPAGWAEAIVAVYAADGTTLIETGDYSGRTNGNRATYRFASPGRTLPANCVLSVGQRKYLVPYPARRYE